MILLNLFIEGITSFIQSTGLAKIFAATAETPLAFAGVDFGTIIMLAVSCVLIYLAIGKEFEPLLLLPIAFGMLLSNLPMANIMHNVLFVGHGEEHFAIDFGKILHEGGLFDLLYLGVKLGIYPSLIFLGIGAMTDFSPLIANPKSLLLGAAAQLGVFLAFFGALLLGFNIYEAMSIGIIGGADGPTAILVTKTLAPKLLPAIAVAAYSYMALIPIIQPPIMKALTTKKERSVKMQQLRPVSRLERLIFPIVVTIVVALIVPDAVPLVGCLMLGNLLKESGVTERLSKTVQ
ncbi:MAG: sodium ion-translocating decarboxylase subunit beta, partial [Clostridia bacterium]